MTLAPGEFDRLRERIYAHADHALRETPHAYRDRYFAREGDVNRLDAVEKTLDENAWFLKGGRSHRSVRSPGGTYSRSPAAGRPDPHGERYNGQTVSGPLSQAFWLGLNFGR